MCVAFSLSTISAIARRKGMGSIFVSLATLAIGSLGQVAQAQSFQPLQVPAPSQVTPRNIAPLPQPAPKPVHPKPDITPPSVPNDPTLAVDAGNAHINGAFPEMALANAVFVASIAHRHVTIAQIYDAARALEQAYARRGYILARVGVPHQTLEPGATVEVTVVDGVIEDVDLSHLAAPLRAVVRSRVKTLIGKHHVTQALIERGLMLAGDVAGARLRSAIAPGFVAGSSRLVIEGEFVRVEGQVGANNKLPASLGRWQFTGNIALNGPLGLGDQFYVSAGSQADIGRYGFPKSELGMIGAGYVVPIGTKGTTLTGEFLNSRTQPKPVAGVPQTVGQYSRGLFRVSVPAVRTRNETLNLTSTVELITQSEKLTQFNTQASRDHYVAFRFGVDWQRYFANVPVSFNTTLSQGLDGRDATASLPTSRQGASAAFTNLETTGRVTLPGPAGLAVDFIARDKTGFGRPLFLSEQFALDAANGVSSFPSGSFNVDSGATLRTELRYHPLTLGRSLTIAPYLFGAGGLGWIARPTAVEQGGTGYFKAASAGLGSRFGLNALPFLTRSGATISAEFGHQFSNVTGRSDGERADLTAALSF